jgi:hypothetical protein
MRQGARQVVLVLVAAIALAIGTFGVAAAYTASCGNCGGDGTLIADARIDDSAARSGSLVAPVSKAAVSQQTGTVPALPSTATDSYLPVAIFALGVAALGGIALALRRIS